MPVNALWLQNVDYPARIDRTVFDNIWTEGILGSGSFQVSPSSPAGMSVTVSAGVAVVQGDDQLFQGKYLCREQASTNSLPITAAPGFGGRHDLVVLQVRDPNASGAAGDDAVIAVVTGVASATPVDPAIPPSSLVLARVRVSSGTGSITAGLIDDLRVLSKDAYNTIPNNSISLSELTSSVIDSLVPTGTITAFGGTVAPTGWRLCDGSALATASFPALFAVIGNQYDVSGGQSSPGAGQFRVPLLTGRVPVGRDAGQTEFDAMGETGGVKNVTLTGAQSGIAVHSHSISLSGTTGNNNADHTHPQQGTFPSSPQDTNHQHAQQGSINTEGQAQDHFHSGTTAGGGSHGHSLNIHGNVAQSHGHTSTGADTVAGTPNPLTGSSVSRSSPVNSAANHTHTFNTGGTSNSHAHVVNLSGSTGSNNANHAHTTTISGNTQQQSNNHAHTFSSSGTSGSTTATNASQAHENLQPYIVVNYIIKA
jgi:microcystin-dependent protein